MHVQCAMGISASTSPIALTRHPAPEPLTSIDSHSHTFHALSPKQNDSCRLPFMYDSAGLASSRQQTVQQTDRQTVRQTISDMIWLPLTATRPL